MHSFRKCMMFILWLIAEAYISATGCKHNQVPYLRGCHVQSLAERRSYYWKHLLCFSSSMFTLTVCVEKR